MKLKKWKSITANSVCPTCQQELTKYHGMLTATKKNVGKQQFEIVGFPTFFIYSSYPD